MTLQILACLALGIGLGAALGSGGISFDTEVFFTPALCLLIAAVGLELGESLRRKGFLALVRHTHHALGGIICSVAGSLTGGVLSGLILGMAMGHALSIAAGLGWYSLSGVMIAGLGGRQLGAVAFLANVLRESLAFVLIPILGRRGHTIAAISTAGATSMDTALPLISASCGKEAAPASFVHGLLLSFLVPFLVPALFSLQI